MQKIFTSLVLCITLAFNASAQHSAGKTTVGGSRWYSYGHYLDTFLRYGISGNVTDTAQVLMWQDTAGIAVYTAGPSHVTVVSAGVLFHPQAPGFNESALFGGEILLDTTSAYTIDSVRLFGYYRFNPAKAGIIDTLVLSIMVDTALTDTMWVFGTDTVYYPALTCDYSTGVAASSSVPTPVVYKKNLTSANWGDTNSNGVFSSLFSLSTPISVPASGKVIATFSFRSGDPARPALPFGDTVCAIAGYYKYNSFFPASVYAKNSSGDPVYPPYDSLDDNQTIYADRAFPDRYLPSRHAWTLGGSVNIFQHSLMEWHVNCSSCPLIPRADASVNNLTASFAKVYPSPAADVLNVEASTNGAQFVLTDILGHTLLTQTLTGNTATINIAAFPSGIYIYTLRSGSNIATGRVSIVH